MPKFKGSITQIQESDFNVNEVYEVADGQVMAVTTQSPGESSSAIFDDDAYMNIGEVPGTDYKYVMWGLDNQEPYRIIRTIEHDEVLSANKHMNIMTCYGCGIQFKDRETKEVSKDQALKMFWLRNNKSKLFLEQCTDMKYFFWNICVIILSKDNSRIVRVIHKDVENCRLEPADKNGKIQHVFYGDWREESTVHVNTSGENVDKEFEVIPLLDIDDPWGDLARRMGRMPDDYTGETVDPEKVNEHKFAIMTSYPIPGSRYYSRPYYLAALRGHWYRIKRLIEVGLLSKIRNTASIRYHVEIHKDYWRSRAEQLGLNKPEQVKAMIANTIEDIKKFLLGAENAGKTWISTFYTDLSTGKEQPMVKINKIDAKTEGGDWAEDIQEAANMLCYADNIHPNLVGAIPGKSANNNSGSDKRELFTMKQALEISYHDIMLMPYYVILLFNGWYDQVDIEVPLIMLTTLDKNTDAAKAAMTSNPNTEDNDPGNK